MATTRTTYILALVCAGLFYLVYPLWLAWYLLVLVVLFLPFDLVISLPGMLTRRISVSAPPVVEKGAGGSVVINITSERRLPSGLVKFGLRESFEENTLVRRLFCTGAGGSRIELDVDTGSCGLVRYELRTVRILSLMGLFSLPRKINRHATVLVMPQAAVPPNISTLPQNNTLVPKPGGGFSEEHDIRPYRQGDPKNSIHWKLSAKFDEVIVREALEPAPHSRLVKCAGWSSPRERELILARLRWMSEYLLSHDCAHFVQLGGTAQEITTDGDLYNFLHIALGIGKTPSCSLPHFTWVFLVDAREAAG